MPAGEESTLTSVGSGCDTVMTALSDPSALTSEIDASEAFCCEVAPERARLRLATTADESNAVPSENVTPCRSVNVRVRLSEDQDHAVARPGFTVRSTWGRMSES